MHRRVVALGITFITMLALVVVACDPATPIDEETPERATLSPVTLFSVPFTAGGTYVDLKLTGAQYTKVKALVAPGFAVMNAGSSTVTLRFGTFDAATTPVKTTTNKTVFAGSYDDVYLGSAKFSTVEEDLPPGIDTRNITSPPVILRFGSGASASPIPTTTASQTATPGSTSTSAPPPATGNSIAVVGDMCGPECDKVAGLVKTLNPDLILVAGDIAYPDGTLSNYNTNYAPYWGQFKAKTKPVPGNHDHHTNNAQGFRDYFGFGSKPTWYGFDFGGWHFIGLDSELATDAAQTTFYKSELNGLPTCSAAFFHHPIRSDSLHGDSDRMKAFWTAADAAGLDVVFAGHDHVYERYAPINASRAASANGIREFVVGTGGASNYSLDSTRPNMDASFIGHGALLVTLGSSSYSWKFYSIDGSVKDSGSANCTG